MKDAQLILYPSGPDNTGRKAYNVGLNLYGREHANSNANPLMLLACSVDTPIHINRSHLLALHVRVQCGLGLSPYPLVLQKQRRWLIQGGVGLQT